MAAGEILIKWVSDSGAAIRDMRRVESTLGDTASKTDKWSRRTATAHKVVNGAIAGWTATLAAGIYAYSDMVKSAQEDAAAQAKLEVVANRAADATQGQVDAMNDYIDAVAAATTYTDDELRPAMASLVSVTKDTEQSQRLLKTAMDASAASGKPVESVATAIAKAYDGNTTSLKRMFPFLDDATIKSGDFSKIMAELRDNTKGAAKAGADKDQWTVFTQNLDEVKESLGGLATSKGGTKALKDLNKYLLDLKAWVDDNPDTFDKVVKGIAGVTGALIALKAALGIAGLIKGVTEAAGLLMTVISSPFTLAVGWSAFEVWVDDMSDRKGGVWRVLSWVKDLADFLSNPFGTGFQIAAEKLVGTLERMWTVAKNLWSLFTGNSGSTGSLNVGGAVGTTRSLSAAPKLAPAGEVGRIQPAAQTVTNVWVDGTRAKARTGPSPAWQPALTLGVV